MSHTPIVLTYPDSQINVQTIFKDGELLFCLGDIVKILTEQNIALATNSQPDGLFGLIGAQLEVLEEDEKIFLDESVVGSNALENRHYITQPGLFRLILRDTSAACKKFQRWVLHEVLPSIQKYGTYPPPLIDRKESELKRVVKSLLVEIEQREKLEQETKIRFEKHEKMLNELGNKLEGIEQENPGVNYISVDEFLSGKSITDTKKQFIFGWCIKICAEQGFSTRKNIIDGEEIPQFPEYVLMGALKAVETAESEK